MQFAHVTIPSTDIATSVHWYITNFAATVLERDNNRTVLSVGGIKLALENPHSHPPHVTLNVSNEKLIETSRRAGLKIEDRPDGTRGLFIHDPFGNAVELVYAPAPTKTS